MSQFPEINKLEYLFIYISNKYIYLVYTYLMNTYIYVYISLALLPLKRELPSQIFKDPGDARSTKQWGLFCLGGSLLGEVPCSLCTLNTWDLPPECWTRGQGTGRRAPLWFLPLWHLFLQTRLKGTQWSVRPKQRVYMVLL